jgi:hypothetical protein
MSHKDISRILKILSGAVLCAGITGLTSLFTIIRMLPPNDLAYGQGILTTLRDPFVLTVWFVLTLGCSFLSFPIVLWALWRVQLIKAFPIVIVVSAVAASIGALYYAPARSLSEN